MKKLLYQILGVKYDELQELFNTTEFDNVPIYTLIGKVEYPQLYNHNITKDIEFMNKIIEGEHTEYLHGLLEYTNTHKPIAEWCSEDDSFIYDVDQYIKLWCTTFMELREYYYEYTGDISSGKAYSNFKRLKTYIINTEYMMTSLLKKISSSNRELQ